MRVFIMIKNGSFQCNVFFFFLISNQRNVINEENEKYK